MPTIPYAMEERIGSPDLFCGRQKELRLLMKWIAQIPDKTAKSRALLGRRKSGKTAIMQRLFNILWATQGPVVPFYIEIKDEDIWVRDFAMTYYTTFLTQYLYFVGQLPLSGDNKPLPIQELRELAGQLQRPYVQKDIDRFMIHYNAKTISLITDFAFSSPHGYARNFNCSFLVMIDEIQYMTRHIYRDENLTVQLRNLPGAFHGLSESKIAPMLVSGSYVGWMAKMMQEMFVGGRLKWTPITPKLSPEAGLEAVYRYAEYYKTPISDESAVVMNELTQSDPFYMACLFRSDYEEDLSSSAGVIRTLDYEIEHEASELNRTWSEYIDNTLREVNDIHAKKILLLLSKERHQELTRTKINETLNLHMEDRELERKLETLIYGDLIGRGKSYFRYKGIPDDILDRIFRHRYQDEITEELPRLTSEMTTQVEKLKQQYRSLLGRYGELKGRMLEFVVYREVHKASKQNRPIRKFAERFRPVHAEQTAPLIAPQIVDFAPKRYRAVWMNYYFQVEGGPNNEIDVLAEVKPGEQAEEATAYLMFEVKNRDKALPSLQDATLYVEKIARFRQWVTRRSRMPCEVCGVYLSANGFPRDVEEWLHKQGILTTDTSHWIPDLFQPEIGA